ncbi:hypothetical protein JCM5350_004521 [Sporobolomyces pararoseus]
MIKTRLILLSLLLFTSSTSSSSLDKPRLGFLETVLTSTSSPSDSSSSYCKPTGQIQDACCDFEQIEQINNLSLFERLHNLVETSYFRYYKVDLYKDCPFWQEQGSCMNRACGVETIDSDQQDDHLPIEWRSENLGKLKNVSSKPSSPVGCQELKEDSEFCVLEDELDSQGVYVDLIENPERFTGYSGTSSTRVWKAIYQENCFTPVPFIDPTTQNEPFVSLTSSSSSPFSMGGGGLSSGGWGESEKRLVGSLAGPRDLESGQEICLEKRVFYKVISGLHASISSHICQDFLDQQTGEWKPNLECFVSRIGQHPERLENMYFTFVLLLRSLSRSGPSLLKTLGETTSSSSPEMIKTKFELGELVEIAKSCKETFDENSMFLGPQAQILKAEFKQHFRNVSLIMDCVGCDKCRLWGKIQITGLGTALKLLFSDSENEDQEVVLSRSEAVAFVNTLHRLSESLRAVDKFRELWAKRGGVGAGATREIEDEEEEEREQEKIGFSSSSSSPYSSTSRNPSSLVIETGNQVEVEEEESSNNRGEEGEEGDSFDSTSTTTTTGTNTLVGNLTTLPLFCARAIWTKLIDLCEITFRRTTTSMRGDEL